MGIRRDPDVGPRRWDDQAPDALQLSWIGQRLAGRPHVAEAGTGTHAPDPGALVALVAEPRPLGRDWGGGDYFFALELPFHMPGGWFGGGSARLVPARRAGAPAPTIPPHPTMPGVTRWLLAPAC